MQINFLWSFFGFNDVSELFAPFCVYVNNLDKELEGIKSEKVSRVVFRKTKSRCYQYDRFSHGDSAQNPAT